MPRITPICVIAGVVMVGDCDVPLVLDIADVIADRISGARKLVFDDTAHMINMERPAAFNQAVLRRFRRFALEIEDR